MSSELVKYLQKKLEEDYFLSEGDFVRLGFNLAIGEVKLYEAKQMKEQFYQLDERQQEILSKCKEVYTNCDKRVAAMYVYSFLYDSALDNLSVVKILNAFTKWAIEQEKLEEEK